MKAFRIIIGDHSQAGHCKTEVFFATASKTYANIRKAFKKGSKKCGFLLDRNLCSFYMTKEEYLKLIDNGYKDPETKRRLRSAGDVWLDDGGIEIATIYVFLCNLGDADLGMDLVETVDDITFNESYELYNY